MHKTTDMQRRSGERERAISQVAARQLGIDNLGDDDLQEIVMTCNITLDECPGYLTPFQAILKALLLEGVALCSGIYIKLNIYLIPPEIHYTRILFRKRVFYFPYRIIWILEYELQFFFWSAAQ